MFTNTNQKLLWLQKAQQKANRQNWLLNSPMNLREIHELCKCPTKKAGVIVKYIDEEGDAIAVRLKVKMIEDED